MNKNYEQPEILLFRPFGIAPRIKKYLGVTGRRLKVQIADNMNGRMKIQSFSEEEISV
jgi:hypothetical protein